MLTAAEPTPMSTVELGMRLRLRFALDLGLPDHVKRWQDNTLWPQLRRLVTEGVAEKLRVTGKRPDDTYWRLKQAEDADSLESIRQRMNEN